MSADKEKQREVGALIQAYARAKRTEMPEQSAEVVRLSGLLGRQLMQRVDALGFDADKLLEVPPDAAVTTLEMLENEAPLEDANAGARDTSQSAEGRSTMRDRGTANRGRGMRNERRGQRR